MKVATADGRAPLDVTDTVLPHVGVVQYQVARVGTFTIGWESYAWPDREAALHVQYGVWDGRWHPAREPLDDPPTVFGVTLGGGATFAPERAVPDDWCHWLSCHRQSTGGMGGGSAPDKTRVRTAHIVAALVALYLARPDAPQLAIAHERSQAADRVARADRELDRLAKDIQDLSVKWERWRALRDAQEALLHGGGADVAVGAP